MIQKAVIKNINNNIFTIRIPIFETAGSNTEYTTEARLCYEPGNLQSYNINDVVFVAFENDEINDPVIIGKLFTGKEEVSTTFSKNSALTVTGQTVLSENTKIGKLTYDDLYNLVQKVNLINDILSNTIKDLDTISKDIEQFNGVPLTTTNINDIIFAKRDKYFKNKLLNM